MLELSGLVKRFGTTTALNGLDLQARPGEIVGVAGPNGAGKSTIIHVLAGEINEDAGSVTLDGQPVPIADRPRFVTVVHQELQLFPTLTVLENLLIGTSGRRVFKPRPSPDVWAVAEEFGLLSLADRPLDSCSLVVRQLTEIARAMLHRKRIVLLDEPNSALTGVESDRLFNEVMRLKDQGRTIVLLVSHRLSDLDRYCDRVLIVREGKVVSELRGQRATSRRIAQAIVGGAVALNVARAASAVSGAGASGATPSEGEAATVARPHLAPVFAPDGRRAGASRAPDGAKAVVDVRGWTDVREGSFADIDLSVNEGEALFITGQEDGGGREILRSIAGLRAARGSTATLPRVSRGAACYLPGSRSSSLFPNLSVRANLCVRLDDQVLGTRMGILRTGAMTQRARALVQHLEIRTPSLGSPVGSLSGGTQQKVAIGSALAAHPKLLILEDPTRGVDVKTREQIVASLRAFLAVGNSILGFSPELDEVFELADIVRVAVRGRLSEPMRLAAGQTLDGLAQWVDRMNTVGNHTGDGIDHDRTSPDRQEHMNPNASRLPLPDSNESVGQQP